MKKIPGIPAGSKKPARKYGSRLILPACIFLAGILCLTLIGEPVAAQEESGSPDIGAMSAADYCRAGIAQMAQKNWTALASVTNEGLAVYPDDPELLCLKGYVLRKTGHYADAADTVSLAIPKDPKPVRYANRGYAYLAMGKNEDALSDANTALSLNANYTVAYGIQAIALERLGNITGAGQAIDRALRLDPRNAMYWQIKGKVLAARGDCTGAGNAFRKSLALDPDYDLPWPEFTNATEDLAKTGSQCQDRTPVPATHAGLPFGLAIAALAIGAMVRSR